LCRGSALEKELFIWKNKIIEEGLSIKVSGGDSQVLIKLDKNM
jgi:hypothetical protein